MIKCWYWVVLCPKEKSNFVFKCTKGEGELTRWWRHRPPPPPPPGQWWRRGPPLCGCSCARLGPRPHRRLASLLPGRRCCRSLHCTQCRAQPGLRLHVRPLVRRVVLLRLYLRPRRVRGRHSRRRPRGGRGGQSRTEGPSSPCGRAVRVRPAWTSSTGPNCSACDEDPRGPGSWHMR